MAGISSKLKKMAGDAAYAAGYGYGKVRNAIQDVADRPDVQKALGAARHAASDAADKAASLTDHLSPAVREAVDKAVPAIGHAAEVASDTVQHKVVPAVQATAQKAAPAVRDVAAKAVPVVQDAAHKAAPVVKQAATSAGAAAQRAGASAATVARKAGTAAATAACNVAVKNAAGMRDADARPHTVVDPATGQKVTVEAYVKRPDGSHDYDAVYPRGTKSDFGPVGNKLVGMLLIMAGIPMLVLPGPGTAAIAAGLYFMRKGDAEERAKPQGPDEQEFHKGEDASDPRANETLTDEPMPS